MPAALGPAVAEIRVLVDVRLIHVDQQMLIALCSREQVPNALKKGLPPLRVGSAQKLLGLLPRQLEAVQGSADCLAAAEAAKALAHKQHQPLTLAFRSQVHDYGIMGASFGGCSGSKV